MLDDFVADTGYNRAYAALVLRDCGRRLLYGLDESMVEAVASVKPRGGGGRPRVYTEEVRQAVEQLWESFGYLCGKRLVPVLRSSLPFLDEEEFLQVSGPVKNALGRLSPATVDRLLRARRAAMRLKGNSYTRATAALSEQIPIRTFGEWKQVAPGHAQIDLVGHDGGTPSGQCCFTLTVTDVCLGWTKRRAVFNRAAVWVKAALEEIRGAIPFALIELHRRQWKRVHQPQFVAVLQRHQSGHDAQPCRAQKRQLLCRAEELRYGTQTGWLCALHHIRGCGGTQ